MSNSPFDTITADYLSRYGHRQRGLTVARGTCWTVCLAVGVLLAGVLLDWLMVLTDTWRWIISAAGYLVVLSAGWLMCLRPLLRVIDHRRLAIEMEQAEPTLQNRLLSAVELHSAEGASAGSPRLREISQALVADDVRSVNIRRLLPLSRLKPSAPMAGVALSSVAFFMLVPGTDFRHRLARVLMPGANLGRISQTYVAIRTPSPASGVVPAEETTPVTVVVSGRLPDAVYMQYRGSGSDDRQAMHAQDNQQYAVNLAVGSETIEYRIHAGDSVTPWHTLDPRPRPSIATFQQTIRHPAYAGLDDSRVASETGDLKALAGSTADIEFIAAAPLSSAQLSVKWEGHEPESWELHQVEPNRYRTTFPIKQSGSYEVALVDAETGFDNPFLPAYRIQSIKDLPPQIELVDSPHQPLLLPPNDLLPFEIRARDELPLATIGYEVSVNDGSWERKPLDGSLEEGTASQASSVGIDFAELQTVTVSHELDLLPFNLNVGDSVRVRGIAIDRKSQPTYTSILEIIIDADRYDPGTRDAVSNRLAWARVIREWATTVQKASETTAAELELLVKDKPADQVKLAGSIDTSTLEAAVEKSDQTIRYSIGQLPNTTDPIAAAQIEHVGRMIDVVQADLRDWIASLNSEPPPHDSQQANQLKQSTQRWADHARHTDEYASNFIGFDLMLSYTGEMYGLIGLIDSFRPESADHSPWRRLYRYSTVTSNRLKALNTFLAVTANDLPDRSQNITNALRTWIDDRLRPLDDVLDETTEDDPGGKEETLRRLLVDLRRELMDRTNTGSQDSQLHQKTVDGLRDLDRRTGSLSTEIASLGGKLQQLTKAEQAVIASKDAADAEQTERARARVNAVAQRAARDLPVRLQRWATLHQVRPDADARYAADAGLTSRAIESVLSLSDGSSELRGADQKPSTREEVVNAIAGDYKILEAGHRVTHALHQLEQLIQAERWNRNRIVRRFELPLRWDSHLKAIEAAAAALREAKVDDEISGPVDRSRWHVPQSTISQGLSERRWNRDANVPVHRQMQDVHEKLAAPHEQLLPIMEAARQRIAAYVPSIPQLAKDAAESLQQDAPTQPEPETLAGADRPSEPDSPSTDEADSTTEETVSNATAAQTFEEQMQRLIEALVQHANVADVSTFEGIRQARDADAAVDVLKESQEALQRAQADAAALKATAENNELASSPALKHVQEQLDEAQQQTLDLLKMVQQHFANDAKTNQLQDTAATDDPLLAALHQAGLQRQSDRRFESLEQLAQAREKTPQDLLEELEAELQRNPAMQEALSDISRHAVEGARETLARAANEQNVMQRGIESADAELQNLKKPVVQTLSELADRASEIERTLVQQAASAASRGKMPEIHQQLQQQRQQIGQIANQARGVNDVTLMADLRQTAEDVAASLGEVARHVKAISDDAASKQDTATDEDEASRRNLAKALQDENRRMRDVRVRDAENRLKGVQREVANAEQKVRAQENQRKQAENQVRQAEQRAKQNPDNNQFKQALAQATQRQQQAQQQVEIAKAAEEAAKEKRGRYEEVVAAAKATPQPALNAANPAAQSAKEMAAHAAQLADQLSQIARRAADAADTDAAPAPSEGHLQTAETQQQLVQQQVSDAARDLARSSRHEERLNKEAPAEQLGAQAQKVAQTARNEVAAAEGRLADASDAAGQRQQAAQAAASSDQPPQDQAAAETKARESAVAARDALQQSELALRQRAEEMETLLGAENPDGDLATNAAPSDPQAPSGSQGPPGSQASADSQSGGPPGQGPTGKTPQGERSAVAGLQDPEVMAQTLDQLDQQIAAASEGASVAAQSAGQPESSASGSQSPPGSSTPRSEPTTPSSLPASFASRLESEAQAQGRRLAQQRTAAQEASQAPSQQPANSTSGLVSNAAGPGSPEGGEGRLQPVDRRGDDDWGALETLTIEDAADSGTDSLNRAYRSQLEAYFRVLAERSRSQSSSAEGS